MTFFLITVSLVVNKIVISKECHINNIYKKVTFDICKYAWEDFGCEMDRWGFMDIRFYRPSAHVTGQLIRWTRWYDSFPIVDTTATSAGYWTFFHSPSWYIYHCFVNLAFSLSSASTVLTIFSVLQCFWP